MSKYHYKHSRRRSKGTYFLLILIILILGLYIVYSKIQNGTLGETKGNKALLMNCKSEFAQYRAIFEAKQRPMSLNAVEIINNQTELNNFISIWDMPGYSRNFYERTDFKFNDYPIVAFAVTFRAPEFSPLAYDTPNVVFCNSSMELTQESKNVMLGQKY